MARIMSSTPPSPWPRARREVERTEDKSSAETSQFPSLSAASRVQTTRAARSRRQGAAGNSVYTPREEQIRHQALAPGRTFVALDRRGASAVPKPKDDGDDDVEEPSQRSATLSTSAAMTSLSVSFADSSMAPFGGLTSAAKQQGSPTIYAHHNAPHVQARKRAKASASLLVVSTVPHTLSPDEHSRHLSESALLLDDFVRRDGAPTTPFLTSSHLNILAHKVERAIREEAATRRVASSVSDGIVARAVEDVRLACCEAFKSHECAQSLLTGKSDPLKPTSDFSAFDSLLKVVRSVQDRSERCFTAIAEGFTAALLRCTRLFEAATLHIGRDLSSELVFLASYAVKMADQIGLSGTERQSLLEALALLVSQEAARTAPNSTFTQLMAGQPALRKDVQRAVRSEVGRQFSARPADGTTSYSSSALVTPRLSALLHVLHLIRTADPLADQRPESHYLLSLDATPFLRDFESWAVSGGDSSAPHADTAAPRFICDVPCLLSLGAKHRILADSIEHQRNALHRAEITLPMQTNLRLHGPLRIVVRRDQVVGDTREGLETVGLLPALEVKFDEEEGTGKGVMREWALLLSQSIFRPVNQGGILALPPRDEEIEGGLAHISPSASTELCRLAGNLLGLTLLHGLTLASSVRISPTLPRFALSHRTSPSLADLATVRPALARGLQALLDTHCASDMVGVYDGWTFQWDGVPLVPSREETPPPLTFDNRHDFVGLLCAHLLRSASPEMSALRAGVQAVLGPLESTPHLALSLFSDMELQRTVFGRSFERVDVKMLRLQATHEGLIGSDARDGQLVENFWAYWASLPDEDAARLLGFITGCDTLPALEGSIRLTITLVGAWGTDGEDVYARLPSASTCQTRLFLARCGAEGLKGGLERAMRESGGFHLR